MSMDDMSFADLLDTCQVHLKRPRIEPESSQGKAVGKGRSKSRSNSSTTSSKHEGDTELLMMLAKLTLRQEDMLNQMALDRSFLLFLQAGRGSILPEMILTAKEWHHQRQNSGVTCSLRQVNFLKVIELLIQRLTKLKYDNPEDPWYKPFDRKVSCQQRTLGVTLRGTTQPSAFGRRSNHRSHTRRFRSSPFSSHN